MKYNNIKKKHDDIFFDSKREAWRYAELKMLLKAGEISNLELQKEFVLIPAQYETFERYGKNGRRLKDGKKRIENKCAYKADFVYTNKAGEIVVEDTKGYRTTDYIIKRKLMLYVHGIRIKEL